MNMETIKSYAAAKGAKAAAKKEGCTDPVITEVDGRYTWAAQPVEAPAPAASAPKAAKIKKAATEAAPVEPKAEKVAPVIQNGVRRPKAGGLCDAIWTWLDANGDCPVARIKELAVQLGWNPGNAAIEIYQWRKFNGLRKPVALSK